MRRKKNRYAKAYDFSLEPDCSELACLALLDWKFSSKFFPLYDELGYCLSFPFPSLEYGEGERLANFPWSFLLLL